MALPPSTANWHWRSKDVSPWAKSWFQSQLVDAVIFTEGTATAKIDSLKSFEGDAEVGMRKSKLLTIYDVKLEYGWSGTSSDGASVNGKINLPEVSHDVGADGDGDYEYEITISSSETAEVAKLRELLQRHLKEFLRAKLSVFPEAMLEAHGKDLKVQGTPGASGAATPVGNSPAAGVSAADAAAKLKAVKEAKPAKSLNTATVEVKSTFQASADMLYNIFTDAEQIKRWTRADAKSKPEVNSEYSLFGGGVRGKYLTLEPPKQIVQTWTQSHINAIMTISLDQKSDYTEVTLKLTGVPVGEEETLRRNLNTYYIHGLNSIGYVSITSEFFNSLSSASLPFPKVSAQSDKSPSQCSSWAIVLSLVASVVLAGVGSRYLK